VSAVCCRPLQSTRTNPYRALVGMARGFVGGGAGLNKGIMVLITARDVQFSSLGICCGAICMSAWDCAEGQF
jgi:hypothetical protein